MKMSDEKGFSLIEVMVAVVIISIGMLAMASLLMTTIKVNAMSENKMQLTSVATSAMALLEQNATVDYYASTAVEDVYAQFQFRPTVVFVPDPLESGAATIKISFSWIDKFGTHPMELKTRVAVD